MSLILILESIGWWLTFYTFVSLPLSVVVGRLGYVRVATVWLVASLIQLGVIIASSAEVLFMPPTMGLYELDWKTELSHAALFALLNTAWIFTMIPLALRYARQWWCTAE